MKVYVDCADLIICKSGFIARPKCINIVYFTIKIGNYGPCEAKDVTLYDCIPCIVKNPRFSLDDGESWNRWCGKCRLGNLPPCKHFNILIRGVVPNCCNEVVNIAEVTSLTYDPSLNNNIVTTVAYPKCKNK
ncbi:MAG: hypothetical protein RR539_06770 [Clostridium sp.]|uniref:hypothetical protein n=1 Tax=Clostridium sp. TaxID=1506 RepID=UPI002FC6F949